MKKAVLLLSVILHFIAVPLVSPAQKLKKAERAIISDLKSTVYFLADDKLEGRRTGTPGEEKAAIYISEKLKQAGLQPKGDNGTYLQTFTINEGRQILPSTELTIDGEQVAREDFFPLTFSADGQVDAVVSPAIQESGEPWFFDIGFLLSQNKNNPHFDLGAELKKTAATFHSRGATAVIYYNSGGTDPPLAFDGKSKQDPLKIPVVFVDRKASGRFLSKKDDFIKISFHLATGEKTRTGHNVAGYIDNGAPHTVVLGAHFDHLGYGEDRNSLWTGSAEIHNGADDNASGTALVLEMAKLLSKSQFKNNNYLFILFSGEELGLYGSKWFTEHATVPLESINYMINCDMVGRLNDTKTITIGGYGTSPQWSTLPQETKFLRVKFDSSGIGPSDHTSFYLKNIPVLFFFTGTHSDYHKPTDDAEKINFEGTYRIIQYIMDVIKTSDRAGKLAFTKTREPDMGQTPRFTVSLGIMPDYTYSGKGVKVDGVIGGRAAEHAGIKAGNVITKIGEHEVSDINEYMKALAQYKKGDKTTVEFSDGSKSRTAPIEF